MHAWAFFEHKKNAFPMENNTKNITRNKSSFLSITEAKSLHCQKKVAVYCAAAS